MARNDLANNAFRNAQRLLDNTMDKTFEPVTTITRQDATKLAHKMKLDDTVTNLDGSPFNINMNQNYGEADALPLAPDATMESGITEEDLLPKKNWKGIPFLDDMVEKVDKLGSDFQDYMQPYLPNDTEPSETFQESLKAAESKGDYDVVNNLGYMGAYQFGDLRLKDYKAANNIKFTNKEFLADKGLQDKVYDWHEKDIKNYIKKHQLENYIGTTINGTEVTMNGLLGVAHLGGNAGMRKFLKTGGAYNPDDGKTKLSDYLKRFK